MAKTNLGRILIIWKGEYLSTTPYDKLDAVGYDGSSYLCLKPCTGIPLSNTEYWVCIASRGNDGEVHWNNFTEEERNDILSRINLDSLGFTNIDGFYVSDENGNIGLKYDTLGFDAAELSDHFKNLIKLIDGIGLALGITSNTAFAGDKGAALQTSVNNIINSTLFTSFVNVVEDGFFIIDSDGNIGFDVMNYSVTGLKYTIIN